MITLRNSSRTEVTVLSNLFIDNYMPKANGEFVKVYIYLLRTLSSCEDFGLEQMADRLLCTERDITRALKYWEEKELLSLECNSQGELTGILMKMPSSGSSCVPLQEPSVSFGASTPAAAISPSAPEASPVQETAPAVKTASLTADRVKELKQNEEIVQLLYIAEQYLGKTLTPGEMKKILFFYDELKLSPDLIEYLIEYSVSRGHKSIRYIETVAMAWAQEGITSVAMAKEANSRYAREYYTILKSMGISNRNPIDTEISFMNTWLHDYGFTIDIIQEACSRTVLQTGQPSFQYADKILAGWKNKSVKNIEDIRRLDAQHKQRKLEKSRQQSSAKQQKPSNNNRFNNFHQREYDFDEYEKKLLNH